MINLRRPTEVFIAPGSIEEQHLKDGAVNLANGKVVGELPNSKLAEVNLNSAKITGELPNGKLGQIEDVAKIKDDLITLAKVKDDVKVSHFVGGEVAQYVEGTTEESLIESSFPKTPGKYAPQKMRVIASLKVEGEVGDEASLLVYIDEEVSPRVTMVSTSSTYELVQGEVDISDLANGRHKITVKAKADTPTAIAWNDLIDILFVK